MNIAIPLRYKYFNSTNWEYRDVITQDFQLMAEKLGIGLVALMTEGFEEICEECEGLIIPGTAMDSDPKYYDGEVAEYDEGEKALDMALIKYFYEHGKPIFAIGTGMQEVNTFFGGSYARLEGIPEHHNGESHRHKISIKDGSFVSDVFKKADAEVNSMHSWKIDKVAPEFEVVAEADGVVEAIEWKEKKIFATQWHPERCFIDEKEDSVEKKFIEDFLEICKG